MAFKTAQIRRWAWLLPLTALALSGCSEVRYLGQAAVGQIQLLTAARPIREVLADPSTPPEIRRKLQLTQDVREFAFTELGLPQQRAFTSYVQLNRPNVLWSVVAAPEFSLNLRTWCFPIAGCVSYRGYFQESAAREYAVTLRGQGNDSVVQGIPAYSTLGYLPDPLLSTTVQQESDLGLVRLIIHELSHAALYVAGDTAFNESFATSVELAGTRRWIEKYGQPEQRAELEADLQFQALSSIARQEAREALGTLYASGQPVDEMRREKTAIFEHLRAQLNDTLAARGYTGRWKEGSLNNANLGMAGNYSALVPDFQALLDARNGDFPVFLQAARACARRPQAERRTCLIRN